MYYLDHRASILIRLPDLPSWAPLQKDELRALWQRNFDALDQYQFSRGDLQIEPLGGVSNRYRIRSVINEVLPAGIVGGGADDSRTVAGRALTISENAVVTLVDDRLQIDELKLDLLSVD